MFLLLLVILLSCTQPRETRVGQAWTDIFSGVVESQLLTQLQEQIQVGMSEMASAEKRIQEKEAALQTASAPG